MAKKLIEGNIMKKQINLSNETVNNKTDLNELIVVSENLKKLIK